MLRLINKNKVLGAVLFAGIFAMILSRQPFMQNNTDDPRIALKTKDPVIENDQPIVDETLRYSSDKDTSFHHEGKGQPFMQNNTDDPRIALKTKDPVIENDQPIVDETLRYSSDKDTSFHHEGKVYADVTDLLNISILLIARYRTGSSFTASVLQAYPGSFYIFEPLQSLGEGSLILFNGSKFTKNIDRKLAVIQNTLKCNIEGLPLNLLMRFYKDDSLASINDCLNSELMAFARRKNISSTLLHNQHALHFQYPECLCTKFCVSINKLSQMRKKCLVKSKIINQCKKAPIRIFKYIALSFNETKNLMKRDPSLKLVTLLRDPRGKVMSHLVATWHKHEPRKIASDYCSWARSVLSGKEAYLNKHQRQSIYTIQYEHLAMNPIKTARGMYEHLGIPFVQKVKTYVWNITMSGIGEKCEYCVNRGNGTKQALGWIHRIHKDVYNITNNICSDVIKQMGYEMPTFAKLKERYYNPYKSVTMI